jgi:hypothetical protein
LADQAICGIESFSHTPKKAGISPNCQASEWLLHGWETSSRLRALLDQNLTSLTHFSSPEYLFPSL